MHPTVPPRPLCASRSPLATSVLVAVALLVTCRLLPAAPQDKPPADAGAVASFTKALAALEELKKTFETLGKEFQEASPERQLAIRQEAQALQGKGNEILASIADAFAPAYKTAPDDAQVREWIPNVLGLLLQLNRFEQIVTLGKQLMADGHTEGNIEELTGLALFATHRFKDSEELLAKARDGGGIDEQGQRVLADATSYQKLWAKEQEIQKKEADANDLPRVRFETSRGVIELELFENEAPGAVGNFVNLVEKKFYDGIAFHRVIPGFMAQGGDPNTLDEVPFNDGQGGPGYTIACECYVENARMHFAGSLSMAHAGKDTGGSQFFLTHLPTSHLNGKHTVFGRVAKGLDVVRSLQMGDKIVKAEVIRKRDHEYVPPASAKKKEAEEGEGAEKE